MMLIIKRPYSILLAIAILLFLAGIIFFDKYLDIYLNDAYYIVSLHHIAWASSFLLIFCWMLYLLTHNLLFSKTLNWIHILLTASCSVIILVFSYFLSESTESSVTLSSVYNAKGYLNHYRLQETLKKVILITTAILVLGQLTYLMNILMGLAKGKKRQYHPS
ncbi:hypothetical protein KJS94_02730 [Flavihumibacter rivuli]|uniref:hypothetical protein n=1 Tax=Flavihumibacter rivuli TaxID=2838156 RepID=UPI001BDF2ED6|nr:hypothetical protein [Flavihumibacter rivuli]ULQ57111.1 hypothetical protein KJS94_02730 [Flavihumibacter rivuli]